MILDCGCSRSPIGPEFQEHFLLITPVRRAAVIVAALATALLLGACDSSDDGPTDQPTIAPATATADASPSACPASPSPAVDGAGGDCAAPDGSGGGSQLYPDIDPSNFTPRGTDLWGRSTGSPSGAPGDVLAPFGAVPGE
jgi:hypothetical protein